MSADEDLSPKVVGTALTEATTVDPANDEIARLRRCISDLISVLAFPALWIGRDREEILGTSIEALRHTVGLDFVYACLTDSTDGEPIELTRFVQSPNLALKQEQIDQLLLDWSRDDRQNWPLCVRNSIGDNEFSIVPLRLGLNKEIGVLVTGSRRADFPTETERLLLNMAANQVLLGLHEAGELAAQKRIVGELDYLVAQRTKELAAVIDSIPGLVAIMTPNGEVEFINGRVREYFGRTLERLRGWAMNDAVHPDDLPSTVATWRDSIAAGQPYESDHRLRRSDGVYRWFHAAGLPIRAADGHILRWYVLLTDIHRRKTAEEKLRQDELELRRITDAIPNTIHVFRPDGTVLHVNRTALDYSGLTLEDAQREDYVARFLHPEDVERTIEDWRAAIAAGAPFENEVRALAKNGKYRWWLVRYNPLVDEQGRLIRWYATGTDIEDRKQAEERTYSENLMLREEITRSSMFEEIVGSSQPLRKVLAQVAKVAPTESTVLISGETGTGKELIARAIHKRSNRSSGPFISVNCGAIPQALIGSELFGHEKGAFTGATQRRIGRFEVANGGTIFLDEVGELPMETQIALLRVLQEREFERLGSTQPLRVNVRALAATNRDLRKAAEAGTFRPDLFYRLNVFPIEVPPLRERATDIRLLAEYLIARYGKPAGKKFDNIASKTLELFQKYDWPGNIRELQNVIQRGVVICDGPTFSIDETWLTREQARASDPNLVLSGSPVDSERELIERMLAQCRGRISGPSGAAVRLGIPRQTLESKIFRLGINKHRFRA
jgi:formate hydrogenlyase transcriptional activator